MVNKIIIIFCEASLKIGTGHIMRCLTIANMLKSKNYECTFVTSSTSTNLIPQLNNFTTISPNNFIKNPINYHKLYIIFTIFVIWVI